LALNSKHLEIKLCLKPNHFILRDKVIIGFKPKLNKGFSTSLDYAKLLSPNLCC